MECEFEYTSIGLLVRNVFLVSTVIVGSLLLASVGKISALVGAVLLVLVVMLGGVSLYIAQRKGKVTATDNKLIISCFKRIELSYKDIHCAVCDVETHGDRWGQVYYTLVLKLETNGDRAYKLCQPLDLESGYPAKHPDKYKLFIKAQPLTQMCDHIKSRIEKGSDIRGI